MTYEQIVEMLSRPNLTPAVRASFERLLTLRTPPAKPQAALLHPVQEIPPPKPPKRPPSPRAKKRAEARAAELVDSLEKEAKEIDGTGKPFRRRYRADSRFIEPPSNNVDICFRTMIWNAVEALERKSYATRRGKGRRNGLVGKVGVELMRTVLFRLDKSDGGKVYAGYERLAELTQYCERALVYAVQKLAERGFLTAHRRCKWVDTKYGRRQVQDSNAYTYHLPTTGAGKFLLAFFKVASDRSGIAGESTPSQTENIPSEDPSRLWWMVEPITVGDGGYI